MGTHPNQDSDNPATHGSGEPNSPRSDDWHRIGLLVDFLVGTLTPVRIQGRRLMVVNLDGTPKVWADVCPHAGLPLHDGERHGQKLTCRHHGVAYALDTGRNLDAPWDEPPLRGYPTRCEHDQLWVQLPSSAASSTDAQ